MAASSRERMGDIAPETMSEAQKKVAAAIASGPRGAVRGPFQVLLRSPALCAAAQQMGSYLRFECPLDKRLIELATIVVARSWSQQYEWFGHSVDAVKVGVAAETVAAIAEGRRPRDLPEDEEIVYDFITELLATKGVSDATYERAVAKFGEQGVVDITGMVGYYTLLAAQMNVARTARPEGKPEPLPPLPL